MARPGSRLGARAVKRKVRIMPGGATTSLNKPSSRLGIETSGSIKRRGSGVKPERRDLTGGCRAYRITRPGRYPQVYGSLSSTAA